MYEPAAQAMLRYALEVMKSQDTVSAWANGVSGDPSYWYTNIVESKGREAADAMLSEETASRRVIADSLIPIVEGILKHADLDERRTVDERPDAGKRRRETIMVQQSRIPDGSPFSYHGQHLITLTNVWVPGCGCVQPKGTTEFGPGGELGLQWIALAVDELGTPKSIVLGFPCPSQRDVTVNPLRGGFAYVTASCDGRLSGATAEYSIRNNVIDLALGRTTLDEMVGFSGGAGGVSVALPFAGSGEYLQRHLPELGPYLIAKAKALAGEHAH